MVSNTDSFLALVVAILLILLVAWIFMFLWNYVLVNRVFEDGSMKEIDFGTSILLIILIFIFGAIFSPRVQMVIPADAETMNYISKYTKGGKK